MAFYDYQAKYIDIKVYLDIPAHVPAEVMTQMRAYAAKAFRALGGCGLARCDFFLTEDGAIYLNELNTMPGFTQMVNVSTSLGKYGTFLLRPYQGIGNLGTRNV